MARLRTGGGFESWSDDTFQSLLPNGLVLKGQIGKDGLHVRVYEAEDRRLSAVEAVRRVVRFLNLEALGIEGESKISLFRHLRTVADSRMSGLVRIVEIGQADAGDVVWMVTERFSSALSCHLHEDGLPVPVGWKLFRKVAETLSGMHALGMAHGDVRPENIFLNTPRPESESDVLLCDWEIGTLAHLAAGRLEPGERTQLFRDPTWNGELRAPTLPADVYALGQTACELLCGNQAKLGEHPKRDWNDWEPKLIRRGIPRGWRQLLKRLLDPTVASRQRPKSACEVLRLLEAGHSRNHLLRLWGVPITLLVLVLLVVGLYRDIAKKLSVAQTDLEQQKAVALAAEHRHKQELTNEREIDEPDAIRQSVEEMTRKIAKVRGILDSKDSDVIQNKKLRELLDVAAPRTPEDEAREMWRRSFAGQKFGGFKDILKALRPTASAEATVRLNQWIQSVTEAWEALESRKWSKSKQKPAYSDFSKTPWDAEIRSTLFRAWWDDHVESATPAEMAKAAEAALEMLGKLPVKNWIRTDITKVWNDRIKQDLPEWKKWFNLSDPTLLDPWKASLRNPWDETKGNDAKRRLAALKKAATIWQEAAKPDAKGDPSWEKFRDRIDLKVKTLDKIDRDEVELILSRWLDAFENFQTASSPKWTLQLGELTMSPGYGTWRLFTLSTTSGNTVQNKQDWVEDVAGSPPTQPFSTYSPDPTLKAVEFQWKPGDSILVLLEASGTLWRAGDRPNLIEAEFLGPVALWRLQQQGEIRGITEGWSLKIDVPNCPGPPREVFQSLKAEIKSKPATAGK